MDSIDHQGSDRGTQLTYAYPEELAERIARAIPEDGGVEPLKGLHLFRSSTPTEPLHGISKTSFCVIAQGSKEVLLGDSRYRYDPAHYLLATVELPVVGQVLEASAERPYLSLRLYSRPGPRRLGDGGGGSSLLTEPGRRAGDRREPAGRGPAGCHGAPGAAPGFAGRGHGFCGR
jgi:hypothetical protein